MFGFGSFKFCPDEHWPGIAHAMALGLGPWMAVEIPDLIEKGVITYKEKAPAPADS